MGLILYLCEPGCPLYHHASRKNINTCYSSETNPSHAGFHGVQRNTGSSPYYSNFACSDFKTPLRPNSGRITRGAWRRSAEGHLAREPWTTQLLTLPIWCTSRHDLRKRPFSRLETPRSIEPTGARFPCLGINTISAAACCQHAPKEYRKIKIPPNYSGSTICKP